MELECASLAALKKIARELKQNFHTSSRVRGMKTLRAQRRISDCMDERNGVFHGCRYLKKIIGWTAAWPYKALSVEPVRDDIGLECSKSCKRAPEYTRFIAREPMESLDSIDISLVTT